MSWTSCQTVPFKAQKRYARGKKVCCLTYLTTALGQVTCSICKTPRCSGTCMKCSHLSLLSAGNQTKILILILSLYMQEGTIRGALHELPTVGFDQKAWRALADAVEISGSTGFRRYLGWQLFPVPNISGAQGETPSKTWHMNEMECAPSVGDCMVHCLVR